MDEKIENVKISFNKFLQHFYYEEYKPHLKECISTKTFNEIQNEVTQWFNSMIDNFKKIIIHTGGKEEGQYCSYFCPFIFEEKCIRFGPLKKEGIEYIKDQSCLKFGPFISIVIPMEKPE